MYTTHHHSVNLDMMLPLIRRECGIFMSDAQYLSLCRLAPEVIFILYTNRVNLHQLMFFNGNAFSQLLLLSTSNMDLFFATTRFGVSSTVETQLNTFLFSQNRPTPSIVVSNPNMPSYGHTSATTFPGSLFYSGPSHEHPRQHPHGPAQMGFMMDQRAHGGHSTMGPHGNVHGHQ